jgi:hypothetical protein
LHKAHKTAGEALSLATDETHKAHLAGQMGHIQTLIDGVKHSQTAGNLGQHHYMKSIGKI